MDTGGLNMKKETMRKSRFWILWAFLILAAAQILPSGPGLCLALPTDSVIPDLGVPETDGNVLAIAATSTHNKEISDWTVILYVTNINDSGAGSLRQAIADAYNSYAIGFIEGLNGQTITLTSGEIVIDKDLTILGLGMNDLTISGHDASRVFNIAAGKTVEITDLTISHGYVTESNPKGGGIYNEGSLTLNRVNVSNCACEGIGGTSTRAQGGGIYSASGASLTMTDCRVHQNTAEGHHLLVGSDYRADDARGGGLCNFGTLTMNRCEVSNNTASSLEEGSTASYYAEAYGGGIYCDNAAPLTMTNCTISGNVAHGWQGSYGGGINAGDSPVLTFCTVACNEAGGTSDRRGGGVYSYAAAGKGPTIGNSIFANNISTGGGSEAPDLYGNLQSANYNLIFNTSGYTLSGTTKDNIAGSDPLLGDLRLNGASTRTHALNSGSPARNVIPQASLGGITTDQRGQARPYPTGGKADIGAYEAQASTKTVTNTNDSGAGSLRQAIAECIEGDTVAFDAGLSGQTITLTSGELLIDIGVTITGLGMNDLTISGNNASRVFKVAPGADVEISNLTVSQGYIHVSAPKGGGIYNQGSLVLTNVSVSDCTCEGTGGDGNTGSISAQGGGIFNATGASLIMAGCSIRENTAQGRRRYDEDYSLYYADEAHGGGICNFGDLRVDRCEISNNTAKSLDPGTYPPSDRAYAHGGGIYCDNAAPFEITNCTISGNIANGAQGSYGGGINAGASLVLKLCTVACNEAQGSSTKRGGGIYSYAAAGQEPEFYNSLIANNSGAAGADGQDLFGRFESSDFNVLGTADGYTLIGWTDNNVVGQDPKIGSLRFNGGPTRTHALKSGSPAIDLIPNTDIFSGVDQRGESRPYPFMSYGDAGAYEVRPSTQRMVTNTNDSGAGSLRQVLADCVEGDTVVFDAGLSGQTITLTTGELLIDIDVTITGLGMNNLTISGSDASRVFHIAEGQGVEITDLTVAHGKAVSPDSKGGGIKNLGYMLALARVCVRDCLCLGSNTDAEGGGIYSSMNSTLEMENCRVFGNTAEGTGYRGGSDEYYAMSAYGGGICTLGNADITACEVSNNTAKSLHEVIPVADASAKGGGVFCQASGNTTLENCTVSGNITNADGPDRIESLGGGLYANSDTFVNFCTVAYNEVQGGALYSGNVQKGGGMYSTGLAGSGPSLKNSIFANNDCGVSGSGPDLFGHFVSQNYNLISMSGDFTLTGTTTNNLLDSDPLLGPLQDNGGPTWTHALNPSSLAIDWIPASEIGAITTDQRGQPRPSPADGNADIGAYEYKMTLVSLMNWDSPATQGWQKSSGPVNDGLFINAVDGAFYIAAHSTSSGDVRVGAGANASDTRNYYGGWQSPNTDIPFVPDNVYLAKFKISTTQANPLNVPNCRLYAEFIDAAGAYATAGGLRVGKSPFAPDAAGKVFNVYIQPASSMSASIQYVRYKFEVIDFDMAEWGTNTLQDVEVYRFEIPDLDPADKIATFAPPFTGWSTLAFGSPFGDATSGSGGTGLWVETPGPVAPTPRTVDYALWQIAGASSGVVFEADKLYRSVWRLSVPDGTTEGSCARIRLIAGNQGNNWSSELVADPASGYREQMPKVGGTDYSVWQETIPVLYGGADVALNNMGFLFDVADGRADQSGRIFLEQVDLYYYDIP